MRLRKAKGTMMAGRFHASIQKQQRRHGGPKRLGQTMLLERLEDRCLMAVVSWGVDTDGFWDLATNWSDEFGVQRVPGPADDVVIDRPAADVVVTVRSGTQSVRSVLSREALNVTGGSLALAEASEFDDQIRIS